MFLTKFAPSTVPPFEYKVHQFNAVEVSESSFCKIVVRRRIPPIFIGPIIGQIEGLGKFKWRHYEYCLLCSPPKKCLVFAGCMM